MIACVGDGGFLMKAGEINTAVRLKIPVVFVVFRDGFLSLIRVKQKRKEFNRCGVEILDSRFAMGDTLFGAKVFTAKGEEEFRSAFKRALQENEPVAEYDEIL